jgi:hypothetical protein
LPESVGDDSFWTLMPDTLFRLQTLSTAVALDDEAKQIPLSSFSSQRFPTRIVLALL